MDGQIIVLSSTGTMVTQVVVLQGTEIISLTWSCEKFNMDESSTEQNENFTAPTGKSSVIWRTLLYIPYELKILREIAKYLRKRSSLTDFKISHSCFLRRLDGQHINHQIYLQF